MIDKGSTAIENVELANEEDSPKTYYDLQGRRLETPHGVCIEKSVNGHSRKIMIR
jgi:glucuronoarabinoxylan endo-1,4-beta-xylanase